MVRIVLFVLSGLLILAGGVWFFQGVGILPGSYMTGQTRWALYGGLAFIAGCGALLWGLRIKASKSKK
jgi:hypothetical protein